MPHNERTKAHTGKHFRTRAHTQKMVVVLIHMERHERFLRIRAHLIITSVNFLERKLVLK